jgi:PhzF family phenazine biosynthesis protein
MKLQLFQVDAFTSRVFGGNPAGVVPLEEWLPDETLQAIAAENNVAETAFFVPTRAGDADEPDFRLRWFTPTVEVDLCGHATLATAHVLARHLGLKKEHIRFESRSGILETILDGDFIVLDFPSRPGRPSASLDAVATALGARPTEVLQARDTMAVFDDAETVLQLAPDMTRVGFLDTFAVIATAPGDAGGEDGGDTDFVYRFFAPRAGVPEDPATGSAHCTLIPYWAARLERPRLHAAQLSERGAEFRCEHRPGSGSDPGRVRIGGQAVTYLEGSITI